MQISENHLYQLKFPHWELIELGFPPDQLQQLYRITCNDLIKFFVQWDATDFPHFSQQKGSAVTLNFSDFAGDFYRSLLLWVYEKTGIKAYRIVHKRGLVCVLFDHHEARFDTVKEFPQYDFSLFQPVIRENKARGVLETYWKVKMNRGKIPKDLRSTPALLRCQLNPLGGIK